MSQEPVSVTYSLEETLKQLNGKLDKLDAKFDTKLDKLDAKFDAKFDKLDERLNKLEIGQVRLEEKLTGEIKTLDGKLSGQINTLDEKLSEQINALDEKGTGVSKRLENQEFVNRGILIALVVAILGGLAKLFGLVGNP